jgi:class 3 adenylate cyclase/tetratricopeptide (TPR) repeat protein
VRTCPNCGEENPARFRLCGYCGAPLVAALPPVEVRKTVTIVFSDLKGSTSLGEALDSESLREVMTRYFDAMKRELERHGGTIEKYIGDAVMAVFGLPRIHEDDALRAVRAAAGMQRALAELNDELLRVWGVRLTNRTGVNTGEVVSGDATDGQRLVTGDPVNTAARLEQAAPANEVLIGDLTYQLVRDAVTVEAVEPLELKGKAERVPAYRLVGVRGDDGVTRRSDMPMVGREAELAILRSAFDEATAHGATRLVTVLGDAGVGKSRLIGEFLGSIADEAHTFRGRCLPYGEGITFWPLTEIAREAAAIDEDDTPERARTKLFGLLVDRGVADRVAAAIGLSGEQFTLAELFWGVRRFLEILAERRPVVLVVDDIHWAEATFLDLLEQLSSGEVAAPVVLLCSARHDLVESRASWSEIPGTRTLALAPLSESDSGRIVKNLLGGADLPPDIEAQIVGAAEGNPLYVEQMLSMLVDNGTLRYDVGRWIRADELSELPIPPTIHALLDARLDSLGREERAVIEPASVIGLVFQEMAVAALVPEQIAGAVPGTLVGLDHKQFVHPAPGATTGEGSHRFHHLLIRDAAYGAMLKRARATFHEQFVDWADRVNSGRNRALEFEEILGYHLEQAHRYLAELGPLDEHGLKIGVRAGQRLASAGRRAFARGDMPAAANLLRRAVALYAGEDPRRWWLLPDLAEPLWEQGEFDEADAVLKEAITAAESRGDTVLREHAAIVRLFVENLRSGAEGWAGRVEAEAAVAIPVFEAAGDHVGLVRVWRLLTWLYGNACQYGQAVKAADETIVHARLSGDFRKEMGGASSYALAAYLGPTPVPEAIARCEELVGALGSDRGTEALVLAMLAQLTAMAGDFERARALIERARSTLDDLGRKVLAAGLSTDSWRIEMLAGDPIAAEIGLRRDYASLEAIGEKYFLSTIAAGLAHVLAAQGRIDDAERYSALAEELAGEDDVWSQVLWRSARAKILAHRGEPADARRFAADAIARARATDGTILLADALVDMAEVCQRDGDEVGWRAALDEALRLYEQKADVTSARTMRERLPDSRARSRSSRRGAPSPEGDAAAV